MIPDVFAWWKGPGPEMMGSVSMKLEKIFHCKAKNVKVAHPKTRRKYRLDNIFPQFYQMRCPMETSHLLACLSDFFGVHTVQSL